MEKKSLEILAERNARMADLRKDLFDYPDFGDKFFKLDAPQPAGMNAKDFLIENLRMYKTFIDLSAYVYETHSSSTTDVLTSLIFPPPSTKLEKLTARFGLNNPSGRRKKKASGSKKFSRPWAILYARAVTRCAAPC